MSSCGGHDGDDAGCEPSGDLDSCQQPRRADDEAGDDLPFSESNFVSYRRRGLGATHSMASSPRAALSQGKYSEAETLYRRALETIETTLSTDHPSYSIGVNNLANLLVEQVRASCFLSGEV